MNVPAYILPIVILMVLYLTVSAYIVRRVCVPKRIPVGETPAGCGLPFKPVDYLSKGNRVHGWLVAEPGKAHTGVAVIAHGWGTNASSMLPYAKHFYASGYAVLVYDGRGQGKSDSAGLMSVHQFYEDIEASIDYLVQEHPDIAGRVILLGHSMGAAAAILAVIDDPGIAACIACGAWAEPPEIVKRGLRWKKIPPLLFYWQILLFFLFKNRRLHRSASPLRQIHRLARPLLLVHAADDKLIPDRDTDRLFAQAPKHFVRKAVLPGTGHHNFAESPNFNPTVTAFLQEALSE